MKNEFNSFAKSIILDPKHEHFEFFSFSPFNADVVSAACQAGFMPMEMFNRTVLKLHTHRALLDPSSVHISKTARRNEKKYFLTANKHFDFIVRACQEQHGKDWLSDNLASIFSELHLQKDWRKTKFVSFELYKNLNDAQTGVKEEKEGKQTLDAKNIVAGEFGYYIGSCYASLSGFTLESGAGTVQLISMAKFLARKGIRLWDLGMPLKYKTSLGARTIERKKYHRILQMAYTNTTLH